MTLFLCRMSTAFNSFIASNCRVNKNYETHTHTLHDIQLALARISHSPVQYLRARFLRDRNGESVMCRACLMRSAWAACSECVVCVRCVWCEKMHIRPDVMWYLWDMFWLKGVRLTSKCSWSGLLHTHSLNSLWCAFVEGILGRFLRGSRPVTPWSALESRSKPATRTKP